MTCESCEDSGIVAYLPESSPKADSDVTTADMFYAVCLCDAGQRMRSEHNNGRKVSPLWLVWCYRNQVNPERVTMLENAFTPADLERAGFRKPEQVDTAAAMLAIGKKQKR